MRPRADVLALTVHGPAGALDLMVPAGAVVTDVAREYAAQAGLGAIPLLYSRSGDLLLASATLSELGIDTGGILVAATGVHRAAAQRPERRLQPERPRGAHPIAVVWCAVAAVVAGLAGWCAAQASPGDHDVAVGVLAAAALLGLVPLGPVAVPRLVAAPCFLGAAGFAWAWDPAPERLPMVIGVTAASVAAGAALARAAAGRAEAQLRVLVVAGAARLRRHRSRLPCWAGHPGRPGRCCSPGHCSRPVSSRPCRSTSPTSTSWTSSGSP